MSLTYKHSKYFPNKHLYNCSSKPKTVLCLNIHSKAKDNRSFLIMDSRLFPLSPSSERNFFNGLEPDLKNLHYVNPIQLPSPQQ